MSREAMTGNADTQSGGRTGRFSRPWLVVALLLSGITVGGCAKTVVQSKFERQAAGPTITRPSHVLVYDFTITQADVTENQGIVAGALNALKGTTENERETQIAQEVRNRMADELVAGIRELGLPAERAPRGTPIPADAVAVTGEFLNVDEGNRLRRAVIGFGVGQSTVETQVQVYAPSSSNPTKLLEFRTHADSGSMPGAAVTGGAGAAASGGVTAGAAAANLGIGAVKGYRSQVEEMTGRSADQAVAYLSQFFAKQGWIPTEKVKQVKMAQ